MKSGDYQIHVYVQEGYEFKLGKEDTTCSPMVEVSFNGRSQYTAAIPDTPCASKIPIYWKEHLFIDQKNIVRLLCNQFQHSDEVSKQTISIKVKNKGFLRDQIIGEYDYDITSIYFQEKHTLQHQWIALSNLEGDDITQVQAVIRISISVIAEGDEQVNLQDPDESTLTPQQRALQIPATIKREYKQLKVHFLMAEKLPLLDTFGTIDVFIQCEYSGQKYSTLRGENNPNPNGVQQDKKTQQAPINFSFFIPLQQPLSSDRLAFQFLDHDTVVDELVATLVFSLQELVPKAQAKDGYMKWFNLYGAPGTKGENSDLMKNNPDQASGYNGRILMYFTCENTSSPLKKEAVIDKAINEEALKRKFLGQTYQYQIQAEIGLGCVMPGNDNDQYKVRIQICDDQSLLSEVPKKSSKPTPGYCRWNQRIPIQVGSNIFSCPFPTLKDMGHVIISLINEDGKAISFKKFPATDFEDLNPKFFWVNMKADKAVGVLNEDVDAGILQIRLTINDMQKNGLQSFKSLPSWSKEPSKRLKTQLNVRCFIFQCKDIPSADDNGLSDCYIKVWNQSGKVVKTKTIEDSLNPVFYECKDIFLEADGVENAPPFIFNFWDENLLLKDKFLGRTVIKFDEAAKNQEPKEGWGASLSRVESENIPKPKWHKIRMGNDSSQPSNGKVLCSFIVSADDQVFTKKDFKMKIYKQIPTKFYTVEVQALGMRGLQSFGLMPIKKPYIKFHIKQLMHPSKAAALENIQTNPVSGPDPNINTLISFCLDLPEELIYCPVLTCEVFDQIFLGLCQPNIGSFQIKLGKIRESDNQFKKEILQQTCSLISILQSNLTKSKMQLKLEWEMMKNMNKVQNYLDLKNGTEEERKTNIVEDSESEDLELAKHVPLLINPKDVKGAYVPLIDEGVDMTIVLNVNINDTDKIKSLRKDIDMQMEKIMSNVVQDEIIQWRQMEQQSLNKVLTKLDKMTKQKLKSSIVQLQNEINNECALANKSQRAQAKKDSAQNFTDIVILPKYEYNKTFNIYEEIQMPPLCIYQKIGYNNQTVARKLMGLTDEEKRQLAQKNKDNKFQQTSADFESQSPQTVKSAVASGRITPINVQPTLKQNSLQEQKALNLLKESKTVQILNEKFQNQTEKIAEFERNQKISQMHYRKYYTYELEKSKKIFPNQIFEHIDIWRGQTQSNSFFKKKSAAQVSLKKNVGYFKGMIEIYNQEEREQEQKDQANLEDTLFNLLKQIHAKGSPGVDFMYKDFREIMEILQSKDSEKIWFMFDHLWIDTKPFKKVLSELNFKKQIKLALQKEVKCAVQVHILEAYNLASRDIGSESDPYVIVSCGDVIFNDQKNYQQDQPNPKINKMFQLHATFPGAPILHIRFMDYDDLFGDELIGDTQIDLDDRFYQPEWNKLEYKPIETRQLMCPNSAMKQGSFRMFMRIDDVKNQAKNQKKWNLDVEPDEKFQVRVCVMNCKGVPNMDFEGTSDVFIKAFIDPASKQATDTHYRCQTGNPSFNYRLLFDVDLSTKTKDYSIKLQAWDRDLLTANEYICEWQLCLKTVVQLCSMMNSQIAFTKQFQNLELQERFKDYQNLDFEDDGTFWLTTTDPKAKEGEKAKEIKIRLDIRILPIKYATSSPVGVARSEPNVEPQLPQPIGRFSFSLNPCKMFNQLVGFEFRTKMYCYLCLAVCVALIIAMIPMIFSNFLSTFIMWLFTGSSTPSNQS